jgi:hypothetical protein
MPPSDLPTPNYGRDLAALYPNGRWAQDGSGNYLFLDEPHLWVMSEEGVYVCTINGAYLKPFITLIPDPYNLDLSFAEEHVDKDMDWLFSEIKFDDDDPPKCDQQQMLQDLPPECVQEPQQQCQPAAELPPIAAPDPSPDQEDVDWDSYRPLN